MSDEILDDLRARLTLTRPPLDERNADWSYGVPDSYLRELVAYWRDGYEWRQAEAAINAYEHYQVSVSGVPVHFMRKPGRGPRPIPLILTHGWPWTLGYGLFGSAHGWGGWGGWGGSIVMVEPDERMAVAYVTIQMREPAEDDRGLEVIMAAYDGLQDLRA